MQPLKSITFLSFTLVALVGYNFIGASTEWTSAPSNPPDNNVLPPINVSGTNQVKAGNLGVNILRTATTTGAVWSNQYCDARGENCQMLGGDTTEASFNQRWVEDIFCWATS